VTFEVDHIFICAEVGAPEADQLVKFGLTEGLSSTHRGQGSASRHFFFRNAMLELIWIHDDEEARSPATEKTRLFERWHQRKNVACPFGLCIRPSGSSAGLPFQGWQYAPGYLPKSWSIHIASNSENLSEPMLFYMQSASRPDKFPEAYRQPLQHEIGFGDITRLRWLRPATTPLSPELNAVVSNGSIGVGSDSSHALEVGFDNELQGKSATLMPALPISFFW
jgi:hypothetical protein